MFETDSYSQKRINSFKKLSLEIESCTSNQLYSEHYTPVQESNIKYHFYITHGAVEYHRRLEPLMTFLKYQYANESVISIYDHVGHGFSSGTRSHVDKFDHYIEDFIKFYNTGSELTKTCENKKNIIIAHSMGGLVALMALVLQNNSLSSKVHGIILSNPCIRPVMDVSRSSFSWLKKFPQMLMHFRVPVVHGGVGLTRDLNKAREFDLDPLISKNMSVNMGLEVLKASRKLRSLGYYIDTPCLFLLSGDDLVCDVEMSRLFVSGIDEDLASVSLYPKARHELFNETNREDVFEEISDWLKTQEL